MTTVRLSVSIKSQSTSGNYSDLSWAIILTPSRSVNASMTATAQLDGTTVVNYSGNPGYIAFGTSKTLASGTHRMYHNADGTKSFNSYVYARTNTLGQSWSFQVDHTNSHTLTRIPRTSKPSLSSSTVTMGNTVTVNFNKADPAFQHSATWSFGNQSGTITSKTSASSATWTTPLATLAPVIPDSASGVGQIAVTTWDGTTNLGTEYVNITHVVPSTVRPTVGTISVTDGKGFLTSVGGFVQNKSTANVSVSGSAGIYGSTIKSTAITVGSRQASGASAQVDLPTSGPTPISVTVTDSRGRSATSEYGSITVHRYENPKIDVTASRSDVNNNITPIGNYIKFDGLVTVHDLQVGTWRNTRSVTVTRNLVGSSTKTTLHTTTASTTLSSTIPSPLGAGAINVTQAYVITITATDRLGSVVVRTITVPSGQVSLSIGKTGIGVGKIWQRGALDVGGTAYIEGDLDVTGTVKFGTKDPNYFYDTRNVNSPPSYYYNNYTQEYHRELKTTSVMGVSGARHQYGILETTIPWLDASAGPITQVFQCGTDMWKRESTSTTTWGIWLEFMPNGDWIYRDGQYWLRSGSIVPPSFTFARNDGGASSGTITVNCPYVPPFPYTFNWSVQHGNGFTHISNGGTRFPDSNNQMSIRIVQFGSTSTTALSRIQWQLVNA